MLRPKRGGLHHGPYTASPGHEVLVLLSTRREDRAHCHGVRAEGRKTDTRLRVYSWRRSHKISARSRVPRSRMGLVFNRPGSAAPLSHDAEERRLRWSPLSVALFY